MDKKNKVLVVGSGGRCHAMVEAFARSASVSKIYCAPGNAGIAKKAECVDISVSDISALADFAQQNDVDLTIVGPEASLCAGIADEFNKRGLRIFGPTKAAARIESSKEFAKELMKKANVPTASYESFTDFDKALEYVKGRQLPAVIKYDGLAAGKGVVVAESYEDAENALRNMLVEHGFGRGKVIIEDFLEGSEFSFMCLVNGDKVYPLAIAQDHKRAYDGDQGPNTGGMGAYSPVPFITPEIEKEALETILKPTAKALVENGTPFIGVLYGGLILTDSGPKVIEFNARFGDPETEVVLPRLESDLYEFISAVMEKKDFTAEWSTDGCLGIVLAAKGYPGKYSKELPLHLEGVEGIIYHMGTKTRDGKTVSDGGRVLMVVGKAENLTKARQNALALIEDIATGDYFYRQDIGKGIILDGKKLAAEIKEKIKLTVKDKTARGMRAPKIALVLVGDDPGSRQYIEGKAKDAAETGILAEKILLDKTIPQAELLAEIERLNEDKTVDGIMVQLPLPSHLDEAKVIARIDPDKDVDGFHPINVSALWTGGEGILPCTPKGIIKLLEANDVRIAGKNAVVIGRSNIVGLPMAKMLLNHNATVTIAHTMTDKLKEVTLNADILVVAAGKHSLVTGDMIKPGAVVIDVGINRNKETGKLQGDTVFESCRPVASAITPVPGGVGPLTKASLMENTLEAYLRHIES